LIGVTILGATGTIGVNTLDVIRQHPNEFRVVALTAYNNVDRLFEQCCEWKPQYGVMVDTQAADMLAHRLKSISCDIQVLSGVEGLTRVVNLSEVDTVMAAIVGSAGLLPTLAAVRAGKKVLLANKEALVMSGQILMEAADQHQATLLPIDSEHNAILQCMPSEALQALANPSQGLNALGIHRILLTASGGPFRTYPLEHLHTVTPAQAVAHPNWKMGHKISVDSATMMNKGLEIIEACWLFSTQPDHIEVILHPQSIIHSLVEYIDGSVLAQLGQPDMRIPIAHALAWPRRMTTSVPHLNLIDIARFDFQPVDFERFPCLQLAIDAMRAGGTTPTILNAANEVAVDAFLQARLCFTAIPKLVEMTLSHVSGRQATCLNVILEDDKQAREFAVQAATQLN
jgi:1-deoxy-D-xylulose-5-phosphate reductoisomerase